VTESVLDTILGQLDRSFSVLNSLPGKIGQILTENDWLMSIRSRVGIPGGTCEFDLPAYFSWQHLDPPTRRKDLERWCSCLNPLAESIQILLRLLRESGTPQKVLANEGLFQQNLPQGRTFQLLRLSIDPALDLIPEISGNRLLIAIRLMRKDSADHLQLAAVQADFELTLCS
jgi:cell division protein ZapD